MNKKQLIVAWVAGISLLCLFVTPVFAGPIVPNSSPSHKVSKYDYKDDDQPDAWFFPKDKARWDGYNVNDWNWIELTDHQKDMFISEGISEIEQARNAVVTVENKRRLLYSINREVNDMIDNFPNIKKPMLEILVDSLKENGFIKFNQ